MSNYNTIVVMGGAGYLGRALCRAIRKHFPLAELRVYDLHEVARDRIRACDISQEAAVNAALSGADLVVHAAGVLGTCELFAAPRLAVQVNVLGTVNVLESARKNGVQTLFVPTKPNVWPNIYTATKQAGEHLCMVYHAAYGMDIRMLRWLNVYGPGQKAAPVRKAVPMFILQALEGVPIEVWGDGSQSMHMQYVNDVARISAVYCGASGAHGGIVRDVGGDTQLSVLQLATLVRDMTESSSPIVHKEMRKGETRESVAMLSVNDAKRVADDCTTSMRLEDGLRTTIDYYRDFGPAWRRSQLALHRGVVPTVGAPV